MLVRSVAVVPSAVPGVGDGGEPAGPGAESAGGAPPVRRRRRRRQRPARPRASLHGAADPHQRAACALGAQPAGAGRKRRRRRLGGGLALAGRDLRLAPLVLVAAKRAWVIRRGAHAGLPAPGGGRRRRDADGLARRVG
jgi:hypothetical protein